jgi:CheY-like chemotaxis protein
LVLVVDDDPMVQRILEMLVRSLGYEVDVAADGEEALPLLAYRDYRAVLCDLMMPGMLGTDLYWACQSRRPDMSRRFIFITGSMGLDEAERMVSATAQPCLPKPCRVGELRDALAGAVALAC